MAKSTAPEPRGFRPIGVEVPVDQGFKPIEYERPAAAAALDAAGPEPTKRVARTTQKPATGTPKEA